MKSPKPGKWVISGLHALTQGDQPTKAEYEAMISGGYLDITFKGLELLRNLSEQRKEQTNVR